MVIVHETKGYEYLSKNLLKYDYASPFADCIIL